MDRPPPKGRGAALLAKRLQMQKEEKAIGVEPEAAPEEEPPKPRGRAALLQKMREKRMSKPGGEPESKAEPSPSQSIIPESKEKIEQITKAVSEISFSEKDPVFFKGLY